MHIILSMNSATTNTVKLSKDGRSVTVSSKGAKRGHAFVISTDETGFETRCEVTKAVCRAHFAKLYNEMGWR